MQSSRHSSLRTASQQTRRSWWWTAWAFCQTLSSSLDHLTSASASTSSPPSTLRWRWITMLCFDRVVTSCTSPHRRKTIVFSLPMSLFVVSDSALLVKRTSFIKAWIVQHDILEEFQFTNGKKKERRRRRRKIRRRMKDCSLKIRRLTARTRYHPSYCYWLYLVLAVNSRNVPLTLYRF